MIPLLIIGFLILGSILAANGNKTFQGGTFVGRCGVPFLFGVVFVLFGLFYMVSSFQQESVKSALLLYLLLANLGMALTAIYVCLSRIYKATG